MGYRGLHLMRDICGATSPRLLDAGRMIEFMKAAAGAAGATVVSEGAVNLGRDGNTPRGLTCFVGLDESHVSVHAYEEGGRVAIDVFTCGYKADAGFLIRSLLVEFGGLVVFARDIERFRETGRPQETEGSGQRGSISFPALAPPREVGGTCRNEAGESYMKFRLHPESAETAPGPGGLNADASTVTIKRASISEVRADEEDPKALMMKTDLGWTHVTGVPVDEVMSWLKEGQDDGDTGKPKEDERSGS